MNASTDNGGARARSEQSGRSTVDLEREGEEIRADLDRTLDEIERKLSPGELLDRSVEFLRDNGSDFLKEAGETVRRNPIPVLLTAAGLVWLTASVASSRSSGGRSSVNRSDTEGEDFSALRGGAGDGDFSSRSYSSEGYGRDSGSYDEHGDRVRQATSQMTRKASKVTNKMKETWSSSVQAVQDRTQDARSSLVNLAQEQPIALGALALAAGALLGAAFPITQYENRLVGPVHDRTVTRAKELGQRQYENLREAVTSSLGQNEESGHSRQASAGQPSNQQPEQG